ncbi:T9SS type A sorting domain-containing protein [Hymenobacter sp. DH14]|uniref:T9SS type A sorting domain-containing protein n=1 Tax=Hymenobacter cyanobacteriorum TaxID=2926463 RepID=A0A9X2AIC5_9BACT|nr:T9SS type A sorting domain-containing protein [Hymenobacter cyanobacteriorum]MCI1187599.1 T9SS type A sorting domain-containing protein [Hymenobacter cyanobacteriorum]
MKKPQLLFLAGWLGLTSLAQLAQAQTLDPGFARPTLYSPGFVYSALEQPDGRKVLTGSFARVSGTATSSVVRLNADGTIDAAFQQNLGATSNVYRVDRQSNGQLLLTSFTTTATLMAGGISRNTILRLNADGTGDATFDAGAGTNTASSGSSVDFSLPLPNGQVLATGGFNSFNGTPANNIVRLNATGSIDATFNPGTGPDDYIGTSALLPSGKYLIAGYFSSYNGVTNPAVARLNADGSPDRTFASALPTGSSVDNFAVQPDGRIVVAGYFPYATVTNGLLRLNADGSLDNTFNSSATPGSAVYSYYGHGIEIQPDGKILTAKHDGTANLPIARLNSNGTPDASFAPAISSFNLYSMTLLANGKVLAAGRGSQFGSRPNNGLLQLNTDGTLDPSFLPSFQSVGVIGNVVRQADGKLIVSGNFSEVSGQPVNLLARFNPDGTLDATYIGGATLLSMPQDLALQADGRLLVLYSNSVQRLLVSGAADNSFAGNSLNFSSATADRLLVQPDGRILVAGQPLNSSYPAIVRLLADGSQDGSFSPAFGSGVDRMSVIRTLALQADGRIVVAGTFVPATGTSSSVVRRLDAGGAFDATYSSTTILSGIAAGTVNSIALQADGKAVVGGQFSNVGANVARLTTTGTLDATFAGPSFASGSVSKVLIQPNGRILLGGLFTSVSLPANLARLLATGAADASFAATAVPSSTVRALLVQPDGSIVAGGNFITVNGQPAGGLARIIVPNVLAALASTAVAARTEAWPVPAHTTLTVAPDASAHPQALDLIDGLGRLVRHQEFSTAAPAQLALENLPVGTYLLRVTYAEGVVTRRVQVQ